MQFPLELSDILLATKMIGLMERRKHIFVAVL